MSLHIRKFFFQFLEKLSGRVSAIALFCSKAFQYIHVCLTNGGYRYIVRYQHGAVIFIMFRKIVSSPIWSNVRLLNGSILRNQPCLGQCCCLKMSSSSIFSYKTFAAPLLVKHPSKKKLHLGGKGG